MHVFLFSLIFNAVYQQNTENAYKDFKLLNLHPCMDTQLNECNLENFASKAKFT